MQQPLGTHQFTVHRTYTGFGCTICGRDHPGEPRPEYRVEVDSSGALYHICE